MQLKLIRLIKEDSFTEGMLFIDDKYFCDTMEDCDRNLTSEMTKEEISELKVYGETAIPYGEYTVKITYSPKYKKNLPQVLDVKGFEGIRIHSGNTSQDSLGCILLGYKNNDGTKVLSSRDTCEKFMSLIQDEKDIYLKIMTV